LDDGEINKKAFVKTLQSRYCQCIF